MSNTIGSAVIEVGVDTKGVESGFAKIDGAVTKTGKTLESLGGKATKGFGDIGAGGDQSAKKVEAATKNMIGAIQRTTASMESGSKTSAKYYETLASQRGVNIEALRPYLAQLDAVKAKQEAAAKATVATSNSVGQLGGAVTKIDGITKSAGASLLSFGKSFLLGAAVGLSYDALKGKIFGVIDSMAGLKTLSEKTGSSVENLSKLAFAAKQSGSDIDSVANALAKLAKGMAGADADSKGAGLALKFLGLSAKDAAGDLKDPAAMFAEIAKKLALYKDGAGKVALAQALLGKSGADMLPTLKLIGEQGDIAAKVTDAQATAARQYTRDMAKLTAQQGLLYKTIATAVLPTMTDFANVLLDASKNVNATNKAVKGLAEDNTIGDWADSASLGLARVVDVIKIIPLAFKAVRGSFEAAFADITVLTAGARAMSPPIIAAEFAKGNNPFADFKKILADRNKTLAESNEKYQQLWDADGNATERNMTAAIAKRKSGQAALDALKSKPELLKANFDTSNEDGKNETKAAAAALKAADAYATFIAAIKAKTAESQLEIATGKDATESQKMAIRFDKELTAGKFGLTAAQKAAAKTGAEEALAEFSVAEARERSMKSVAAASQALTDERNTSYAAAVGEATANEELVRTFGLTKEQIEAQTIARLEDRLAQRAALELDDKEVAQLERLIDAKKRNGAAVAQLGALNTGTDVAKAKELLDILVAVDNAAKQAAQGMTDSFGRVGTAIGGLTTALTGYAVQQQAVAAQLATIKADPKSSADKIAQAELAATKASATAKVKSYADMASAAKGFFNENSKGYKVLEGAEKAFRAFEMANQLQKLATSLFVSGATATGVVAGQAVETGAVVAGQAAQNAAKVPGVFMSFMSALGPWGAAAAAVAVAAVLGGAFSGGGGGDTSKKRQETQGTGSILGDSSAKSDSIANSIELAAANSSIELTHTAGMLASLKAIENSISGLGSLLVRGTDISSLAGNVAATSSGGFFGGIVSAIFGGKTSVNDTGVLVGSNTVGGIAQSGINTQSYTDTTKSGGWFSSDKHNTTLAALGSEVDDQFAKVILSLSASIKTAADLLGVGGDAFTTKLNSFVVDIGKISLKDLKGDEIQEALEAVFSKLGDDMAAFGVAGLSNFQKIGEGYFETLTRIATDYANVNSIMESIGTTFGAVGMGSITAREHLIELAGGIDELASKTSSFASNFLSQAEQLAPVQKYVTDQLAAMGLASITTRDQFKDAVLGLANSGALTTEAGAAQYTALLALADAFAKTHAATVDLTKSEQDIADERKDLQTRLNEATMESAKLAELARAAIAPYNLALYDSVLAAEAAKAAADDLATANANYQQQIDALVAASQGAAAVRALETKGMDASTIALYDRLAALKAEDAAIKAATEAAKDAALTLSKALLTAANDAFNGLTGAVNAQKKALDTALKSSMAAMQLQIDKTSASVAKLTSLSGALHSTLDSIRGQTGSAVDDRASAQAQVAAALAIAKAGGMLPDADSLKNALSTLSQDSSDQFSSYLDYQRDLYSTQNNLAALADLTDDQLSTEERALAMLEKQKDLAQLTYDAEVMRLDGLIDTAKASLDVLNGINIGIASIPAALAAFASAIKAAQVNPTVGTDALTELYKDLLGRAPDAAGLKYWQDALASGGSLDHIKSQFMAGDEYTKLHPFAIGTNYIPGDMPAMVHEGERIIPAADNRALMSRLQSPAGNNDAILDELREQRKENAELRVMLESHLYAIAKNTLNTADSLDGAINGETPIATKEVETA